MFGGRRMIPHLAAQRARGDRDAFARRNGQARRRRSYRFAFVATRIGAISALR